MMIVLVVILALVNLFLWSDIFYKQFFKRFYDILFSSVALIVLALPMALVSLLIKKDLGSPVLFKQERIGKDEKPFMLLKFRTMRSAFDEFGVPLPDTQRMTGFGKLLRKTSVDELPSLINIIKGDMSIVGPRPLPTNYLKWFRDDERIRHTVRGGMTGLAQVHGRNSASWEERFRYDADYVEKCSLPMDLEILLKTVMIVFEHKDIGTRGIDTPPDFHVYRSGLTEKELVEKGEQK